MRFVRGLAAPGRCTRATLSVGLLCVGICSLLLATPGRAADAAAADVIKDPNSIRCPAAPPGWLIEVSKTTGTGLGREVRNPMTDPTLEGEDIVLVTCDYFASSGRLRHVLVNVAYALPFDPNPLYDFYYGCGGNGSTTWNAQDRIYRVASEDQWAIATFYDANLDLRSTEVPGFEAVTRQLLGNTEGYAHPCILHSVPSDVSSNFSYTFSSDAGNGVGSFIVVGTAPDTGSVPIASVTHRRFALAFGGHKLTIVVKGGVRFFPPTGHQRDKLILAVAVASSDIPSCDAGDKGTFTLTNTSLEVEICHETLSAGKATGHMTFL